MNKKKMMLVSALLFLLLLLVLLFPIGATSESDNAADVVIDLAMPEDNVIVSDPIQIEVEISEEGSAEEDTTIDVFIEEPSAEEPAAKKFSSARNSCGRARRCMTTCTPAGSLWAPMRLTLP